MDINSPSSTIENDLVNFKYLLDLDLGTRISFDFEDSNYNTDIVIIIVTTENGPSVQDIVVIPLADTPIDTGGEADVADPDNNVLLG